MLLAAVFIMDLIIVDTLEEFIKVGDFIRIKKGEYRGRKAVLVGIDYLSEIGCYRDRHTVKILKDGYKYDCVRECYEHW